MNESNNQAAAKPTERLLELIRSKGQNQEGADWTQDPFGSSLRPGSRATIPGLFSPKHRPQIGLEIADNQLRIVGSITNKGLPRLFLWQVHDFPYKLTSDDTIAHLKALVQETLAQQAQLSGQKLQYWASYEFSREELYLVTLPAMKKRDIPAALTWSLKRNFDADLSNSILDFEIAGHVTENNIKKYQVLAALVDKGEVTRLQQVFSRAGYPLAGITISASASLNLFRSQCQSTAVPNMGLVHIGAQASRIDIVSHQRPILHRKIRTGMRTILDDARPVSGSSDSSSEEQSTEDFLLRYLADPEPDQTDRAEDLFAALEPGTDRLIRQIELTLSYSTRNLGHEPVHRIFLSGRLSAAPPIQAQISKTLDIEVKPLDGFAGKIALAVTQPASLAQRLDLTPALGLSLSKPGRTLNFLHSFVQRAGEETMRKVRLAGIAGVVSLLCILSLYHVWQQLHIGSQQTLLQEKHSQVRNLERRIDSCTERILASQEISEHKELERILHRMHSKYSLWEEYVARFQPLAYLSELLNIVSDNVRIQHIYAYLEDQAPDLDVTIQPAAEGSSELLLYSDPGAGIALRQVRPSDVSRSGNLQTVLVLKGLLTGPDQPPNILLSQLKKRINASPFFQVWERIERKHISTSVGRAIQFHLLLKLT